MQFALGLVMQALMTMPVMAYISFALSLVFVLLWLNPFGLRGSGAQQRSKSIQKARKSPRGHSSAQRRHRPKSGSAPTSTHA
jgi:hypothetical protein